MLHRLRALVDKAIEDRRIQEPLHVLAATAVVKVFGSFRAKVAFDLVRRLHNAYAILKAADDARAMGLRAVTVAEFGVAAGEGLMNMCRIAEQVRRATSVRVDVVGFDTGKGMPPAVDYRDHPDIYQAGDFPMDFKALSAALPPHGRLILGDIRTTGPQFIASLDPAAPLGYAVIDVDYYSSAVECMRMLSGPADRFLPRTMLYFDDVHEEEHNTACGELLAIHEFNAAHPRRRIERYDFLKYKRVFRNKPWLDKIYFLHVLDHPRRSDVTPGQRQRVLANRYLA